MAKGNLFLGFGRGKVGDVVFYHSNGEQIARARNRHPKNPQTALQLLQRVIMKTVSTAYSMLLPITDHSFQNFPAGAENQARFAKRNVSWLRELLADEINSGDPSVILSSVKFNFSSKFSTFPEMNSFIISEGTLPTMGAYFQNGYCVLNPRNTSIGTQYGPVTATYSELVSYLGLQKGDQLTFVVLTCDDTEGGVHSQFNSIHVARMILEPSTGNMDAAVANASGLLNPNERNEGKFNLMIWTFDDTLMLTFSVDGITSDSPESGALAGCAVIASRQGSVTWERSSEALAVRASGGGAGALTQDHKTDFLSDAIYSYLTQDNSSLYLNQARV